MIGIDSLIKHELATSFNIWSHSWPVGAGFPLHCPCWELHNLSGVEVLYVHHHCCCCCCCYAFCCCHLRFFHRLFLVSCSHHHSGWICPHHLHLWNHLNFRIVFKMAVNEFLLMTDFIQLDLFTISIYLKSCLSQCFLFVSMSR